MAKSLRSNVTTLRTGRALKIGKERERGKEGWWQLHIDTVYNVPVLLFLCLKCLEE